jgi:hypothetical protein
MELDFIVGWVLLIASWIVPVFIKDRRNKHVVGAIIAGVSTGVFLGHLLHVFFK